MPPVGAYLSQRATELHGDLHVQLAACDELSQPDSVHTRARLRIQAASGAFDSAIEKFREYAPYLAEIKQAYDAQVRALETARFDAEVQQGESSKRALRCQTLLNYQRLRDDLQAHVTQLSTVRAKLENKAKWLAVRQTMQRKSKLRLLTDDNDIARQHEARRRWLITVIDPDRVTDVPYLEKLVAEHQQFLEALRNNTVSHAHPTRKAILDERIVGLEEEIDELETAVTSKREYLISLQAQIAKQEQVLQDRRQARALEAMRAHSAAVEAQALQQAAVAAAAAAALSAHSLDSSAMDQHALLRANCLREFEEAFHAGQYAAAADLAVNSLDQMLRTDATIARFRHAPHARSSASKRSPLLCYCIALTEASPLPSEAESQLCIETASLDHAYDTIAYWISNAKIALSRRVGMHLEAQCKCTTAKACVCRFNQLAIAVYTSLRNAHNDITRVLVRQHMLQKAVVYAKSHSTVGFDGLLSAYAHHPLAKLGFALSLALPERSCSSVAAKLSKQTAPTCKDIHKAISASDVNSGSTYDKAADQFAACLVASSLGRVVDELNAELAIKQAQEQHSIMLAAEAAAKSRSLKATVELKPPQVIAPRRTAEFRVVPLDLHKIDLVFGAEAEIEHGRVHSRSQSPSRSHSPISAFQPPPAERMNAFEAAAAGVPFLATSGPHEHPRARSPDVTALRSVLQSSTLHASQSPHRDASRTKRSGRSPSPAGRHQASSRSPSGRVAQSSAHNGFAAGVRTPLPPINAPRSAPNSARQRGRPQQREPTPDSKSHKKPATPNIPNGRASLFDADVPDHVLSPPRGATDQSQTASQLEPVVHEVSQIQPVQFDFDARNTAHISMSVGTAASGVQYAQEHQLDVAAVYPPPRLANHQATEVMLASELSANDLLFNFAHPPDAASVQAYPPTTYPPENHQPEAYPPQSQSLQPSYPPQQQQVDEHKMSYPPAAWSPAIINDSAPLASHYGSGESPAFAHPPVVDLGLPMNNRVSLYPPPRNPNIPAQPLMPAEELQYLLPMPYIGMSMYPPPPSHADVLRFDSVIEFAPLYEESPDAEQTDFQFGSGENAVFAMPPALDLSQPVNNQVAMYPPPRSLAADELEPEQLVVTFSPSSVYQPIYPPPISAEASTSNTPEDASRIESSIFAHPPSFDASLPVNNTVTVYPPQRVYPEYSVVHTTTNHEVLGSSDLLTNDISIYPPPNDLSAQSSSQDASIWEHAYPPMVADASEVYPPAYPPTLAPTQPLYPPQSTQLHAAQYEPSEATRDVKE